MKEATPKGPKTHKTQGPREVPIKKLSKPIDMPKASKGPQKPKQLTLGHGSKAEKEFKFDKEFGGSLLKESHAKKKRPICTKNTMHITLRSTKAKGSRSFLATPKRARLIQSKVYSNASRFGVRIYRYANVGNHLHLLVRAGYRKGLIAFLRAISGIIARIATGKERGKVVGSAVGKMVAGIAKKAAKRVTGKDQQTGSPPLAPFWDQRPWTRVVTWMSDFLNVAKYVRQNFDEAMGFVAYKPRATASNAGTAASKSRAGTFSSG